MNKSTQKAMFSSKSDEWSTCDKFYNKIDKIHHFTLDPCATHENHKCDKYYTMEDDGLKQSWAGETVFVNPPYSKIKEWIQKAYIEALNCPGTKVVMLLPARTDTKYFHDYCMEASEILFVKGRLKFGNQKNSAPFPSMVVIFEHGLFEGAPQLGTLERI